MSNSQFGATRLGYYEGDGADGADIRRGWHVSPDDSQPTVDTSVSTGGGASSTRSTQPVTTQKTPGGDGVTGGTSTSTSGGANNTNSTSPEFNSLMNSLNNLAAAGAPMTPPLQDNNTPTVVPTQTSSKSASLAIVLFIIAGALGYYYYRKHGGASVHEAL